MSRIIKMEQKVDPALTIYQKLNMKKDKEGIWHLPAGYEFGGNSVLIASYERPEKTAGGVFLTDRARDEEKNQGKACLVIDMGPTAFVSDKNYDFAGFKAERGQWVSVWVYEARPIVIEGHTCRLARDTDIKIKIPSPDRIY